MDSPIHDDPLVALLDFTAPPPLTLPNPEDLALSDPDFTAQIDSAWQVCDRFDLQTDISRGRILRVVRDREKASGRGIGFMAWLREHDISKSQAYRWLELADSADQLLSQGHVNPEAVQKLIQYSSKRAFIETAQASPEVQAMIGAEAEQGKLITRREVRALNEEYVATHSDLVPEPVRAKVAEQVIPPRYLTPLVKEMAKLSPQHQEAVRAEVAAEPDLDGIRSATASARHLSRYLEAAARVQGLAEACDLEAALDESLRLGCLNQTAELVNQAALLEQMLGKMYTTWKRVGNLADSLYTFTGASSPHLRQLLTRLESLSKSQVSIDLGHRVVAVRIEDESGGQEE